MGSPGDQTPNLPSAAEVSALLRDWSNGDSSALERLAPLVYDQLRQVARAHLRGERANHTLQATALVNEVYLRFAELHRMRLQDRTHFLAMAARLMRRVLIDHARRKRAAKRGRAADAVSLTEVALVVQPGTVDVLDLDRALDELSALDQRQGRVVEMRFFAGLSNDEVAEALGISRATVERDWVMAKAWLFHRLTARPA